MSNTVVSNERQNAFLQKLVELSSQHRVEWLTIPRYLATSKNEPLRKFIIDENNYAYKKEANNHMWVKEYFSYVMRFAEGTVVLLYGRYNGAFLIKIAIQTDTACPLEFLEGYNENEASALYSIVSDNNYPVNQFMQRIIDL